MREWVSVNGELMPAAQATVSAFDSGFLQGVGLFETLRAYAGRPFRLDRHIARLRASAAALGWTVIPEAEVLEDNVSQVVAASDVDDLRVRLTVTTGRVPSGAAERDVGLTIVASAAPHVDYPRELYQKGATVTLSPYAQGNDPTFGHKTTSYFARLAALRGAHQAGATEALWRTPDGRLAEGSISNLFLVIDGELCTPPLNTPVLPGITRAAVLEAAARVRVPASEEPLVPEDLRQCDEAFITNSMIEILPVVRVGREPIGNEKPGEITIRLYEALSSLIREELQLE